MPNVDFTLADIKHLIDESIDQRLIAERGHTVSLVRTIVRAEIKSYDENLKEFLTHQFGEIHPRLDRIERELKGLKRVVRKHSADIAELQAVALP